MEKTLTLTLRPDQRGHFFPLFQQGVLIKTIVGTNINALLVRHLGLNPDYVETRIQTVFLNGKAVDDLDHTVVKDGSSLALSGALPGLVGATFRRGGTYASLRQAITVTEGQESSSEKEGRVILKLFNLLLPELTPFFLARGVWIKGGDLGRLVKDLPIDSREKKEDGVHWEGISRSEIEDLSEEGLIRLRVIFNPLPVTSHPFPQND